MNIINLYENYNSYFNKDLKAIFEKISNIASTNNYKIYLIGGLVRDLLLNKESIDVDITVEGDAIKFARVLEDKCSGKILSIHKDFGTVKVEINGTKIDFASTRSEIYPNKGHLPHVEEIGCKLEKDVLRRDFTINSLAMSLNQDSFADLIDYVDGYNDLKTKKIKVLHEKSFIDDPTRIIRALKYSVRFGFELDAKTLKLQKQYLKNVNYDMCNKRLKNEIKKTFEQEPKIAQIAFDNLISQDILNLITPNKTKPIKKNIEKLINQYTPKHHWLVYLGVIAVFENSSLLDKLELTKSEKNIITDAKELIKKEFTSDFEIYKNFYSKKIETLIILAAINKTEEVIHYLKDLRAIKLHINGNDLLALGLPPSKSFGRVFDYALQEKLKNPHLKKAEEIELIKWYLSSRGINL